MHTIFTDIGRIYGIQPEGLDRLSGRAMQAVSHLDHAWLEVRNGRISGFGKMDNLDPSHDATLHSMAGKWIAPGFVDSHTHIVFAASREEEFRMRIQGHSYEAIAAAGGGILNSARKLRAMAEDELFEQATQRLNLMISLGTTCLEIKSGYGLDTASELKMLRVIQRLKAHFPLNIRATFLGAHAIPSEYAGRRAAYIDLICDEMLPAVAAENLADFVDVFCDKGFFTPEETGHILEKAAGFGLIPKIHANELGLTGGVQTGVAHGALSVDHLEHCGEDEINALLQSHTFPVALPGTSYFLGIPYAPVRRMIDAGLPVVLASDFNPGSSPGPGMQMVWSLACTQMKLLPEEAFNAITLNAAAALKLADECGSITPGKRADFLVFGGDPSLAIVPYHFGMNHVLETYLAGNRHSTS
jgi:imidazolonepropionase